MLPSEWVTLQDVYHCAIDKDLFARKIEQAHAYAADMGDEWISLAGDDYFPHIADLAPFGFKTHPTDDTRVRARARAPVRAFLTAHTITHQRERTESTTAREIRLRVEAVNRWYVHDWNTLDNKIRSSIVEGVSVFLSMFDLLADAEGRELPALAGTAFSHDLPPLDQLIEGGKVLALNMPAGTNPALARAIGVMLKNGRWCADAGRPPRFKPSRPSPTDAVRDGSAKLGHPVQNVTREHGLTPLPR